MGSWNLPVLFWSAMAQAHHSSSAAAIMVGSEESPMEWQ